MINLSDQESLLFALLKSSLHGGQEGIVSERYFDDDGLERFCALAEWQGVAALAFSEFGRVPKECYSHGAAFERVISGAFACQQDYDKKMQTAVLYAEALRGEGILCYVLKGLSFASYYSRPELRRFGDLDLFLVDERSSERNVSEIGDEVAEGMGARYVFATRKHSHLLFRNLKIENHYYLIPDGWKGERAEIESIFRKLLFSDAASLIQNTELMCPNIRFNALYGLYHSLEDFISVGMKLKMIYDWAALLQSQQNKIDWEKLNEDIDRCCVRRFADVLTAVCVDYLGVEVTNPVVRRSNDVRLVDDVVADVLRNGMIPISTRLSFPAKVKKILKRCVRFWHYRVMLPDGFVISVCNLLKDKIILACK